MKRTEPLEQKPVPKRRPPQPDDCLRCGSVGAISAVSGYCEVCDHKPEKKRT